MRGRLSKVSITIIIRHSKEIKILFNQKPKGKTNKEKESHLDYSFLECRNSRMNFEHLPICLSLVAIYAVYGSTFLLAGGMKIREGRVPQWFTDQFSKTFLAKFPGTVIAYWSIALLECLVPVLLVISLFNGEFKDGVDPVFLGSAVALAGIIFGILGFGLRLVNDFQGAANSFFYFAASLVTQIFLQTVIK